MLSYECPTLPQLAWQIVGLLATCALLCFQILGHHGQEVGGLFVVRPDIDHVSKCLLRLGPLALLRRPQTFGVAVSYALLFLHSLQPFRPAFVLRVQL
jgi:hypothetical protein